MIAVITYIYWLSLKKIILLFPGLSLDRGRTILADARPARTGPARKWRVSGIGDRGSRGTTAHRSTDIGSTGYSL